MEKKLLGHSDLYISRLGLGSWAIGGDIGEWGWGKQSTQDSINTIHAALDNGINWIDTAPAYGLGNAEKIINKALKQTSSKPYIFTKCGLCWKPGETELFNRISRQSIIKEVEDSLRRLDVEVIDLYQIHWPRPETDIIEAWQTLADLKKQGKVRHIGVSNFSAEQLQQVHTVSPVISNQPGYSLLNRSAEKEVLPWCLEHNVGTIHHSTMASGLLSGAMNKDRFARLSKNDWRHKHHLYQEPTFSRNLEMVEHLKVIAEDKGCNVAELSIAWTLSHPATTGSIIGARSAEQLSGLINASEITLAEQDHSRINVVFSNKQSETV
ncbi:aldo/keto reductase [Photobacterium gaetbulicola]|uniref:Aldo/keto reductase n=1 Tax=Photobacterium gaetbulicola TaxID=1295392 RepID=A0A0B9FPT7_9GAMM|nr:aldo/keto reductase [Photobacterium gaetbulicola]KHT58069.1 aldo/keto reductase [Photobacterium gaetbulicola]